MELIEKHLILVTTKPDPNNSTKVIFKEHSRWDVPNEVSYSRLQVAIDAVCDRLERPTVEDVLMDLCGSIDRTGWDSGDSECLRMVSEYADKVREAVRAE